MRWVTVFLVRIVQAAGMISRSGVKTAIWEVKSHECFP